MHNLWMPDLNLNSQSWIPQPSSITYPEEILVKTCISQLCFIGLLATFFVPFLSENAHALGSEDRNLIYERSDILRRSKNLRGRRQGFIFGIGTGVGITNFEAPLAEYWGSAYEGSWPDPRSTASAFATELKVGHGFTDQFLLYYTSRIAWLPLSNLYRDTMIANGAAGVGMMLYPLRSSDFYLVGSAGLAVLVTYQPPFKLEKARQTGLAVSCGVGYEFLRHLTIDFTLNFGNANSSQHDEANEITLTNEIVTFLVNVNLIFY